VPDKSCSTGMTSPGLSSLAAFACQSPPPPRPVGRVTAAEDGTFTLDATSAASPYLGVSLERYQTAWASVLEVNSPQVARDLKWFKGYGSRRVCQ